MSAVSAHFETAYHNVEPAFTLNLSFQAVEQVALEFADLAAAQACHVNVIPLRATLVIMLFALHVHEVKLIDQPVPLEQSEGAIDRDSVHSRIDSASSAEKLAGIQMLLRSLHHAQNGAALAGHAQAARHKFGLQPAGCFGLG